jgi:hypothetical protein
MDTKTQNEIENPIVLHDENKRAFAFHPLRALRNGADLFLIAEHKKAGTLHVLSRKNNLLKLVRDDAVLQRVTLRLEILRRATEGDLVEWTDPDGRPRFLGVLHRGEAAGEPYLLAADLDDPATVIAFQPVADGFRPADERLHASILEQLEIAAAEWVGVFLSLESRTLGMRREVVEVTDSRGVAHAYWAAGRLFFQGRDLLFLSPSHEPERAIAFEAQRQADRAVADQRFLADLHAHLERSSAPESRVNPIDPHESAQRAEEARRHAGALARSKQQPPLRRRHPEPACVRPAPVDVFEKTPASVFGHPSFAPPQVRLDAELDRAQLAAALKTVTSPLPAAARPAASFVASARPPAAVKRAGWAEAAPAVLGGALAALTEKARWLETRAGQVKDALSATDSRNARTVVGFRMAGGFLEKAACHGALARELSKLVPGDTRATLERLMAAHQQFVDVQRHANDAETTLRELPADAREIPRALQNVREINGSRARVAG